MAKRRLLIAIVAVVLGALMATGAAFAGDVRGDRPPVEARGDRDGRDHRAFCERLESKIQHLRAALGRLEALEEKVERLIASGTLTEEQLARARHALAKIERAQEGLEDQLERLLGAYAEKCRR
jgi:hypothetical protein